MAKHPWHQDVVDRHLHNCVWYMFIIWTTHNRPLHRHQGTYAPFPHFGWGQWEKSDTLVLQCFRLNTFPSVNKTTNLLHLGCGKSIYMAHEVTPHSSQMRSRCNGFLWCPTNIGYMIICVCFYHDTHRNSTDSRYPRIIYSIPRACIFRQPATVNVAWFPWNVAVMKCKEMDVFDPCMNIHHWNISLVVGSMNIWVALIKWKAYHWSPVAFSVFENVNSGAIVTSSITSGVRHYDAFIVTIALLTRTTQHGGSPSLQAHNNPTPPCRVISHD